MWPGGGLLYDGFMKRAYLADAQTEERSALRLMLLDLNLQVIGEAADWPTTLAQAPASRPNMVVDWGLVANGLGAVHSSSSVGTSGQPLVKLRLACATAVVIVLISYLDALQQAALSAGASPAHENGGTDLRRTGPYIGPGLARSGLFCGRQSCRQQKGDRAGDLWPSLP